MLSTLIDRFFVVAFFLLFLESVDFQYRMLVALPTEGAIIILLGDRSEFSSVACLN